MLIQKSKSNTTMRTYRKRRIILQDGKMGAFTEMCGKFRNDAKSKIHTNSKNNYS